MRKKHQTPRPKVKIEEQNNLPACTSDNEFLFGIAVSQTGVYNVSTIMSLCELAPSYGDQIDQFTQNCCMEVLGTDSPEGGLGTDLINTLGTGSPEGGDGNAVFTNDDAVADDPAMGDYSCNASHPMAPQVEDFPGGGTDPNYLQAKAAFLKKCREKSRLKKDRPKPRIKTKGKTKKGLPRRSMDPQNRMQESLIKRLKKLANINSKKNG